MNGIGQPERATQNRVIALFRDELGYRYVGDRADRENNSNIEERLLTTFLQRSGYTVMQAAKDHAGPLAHQSIDYFKELSYYDRKALHNLKYFTWVEQQGRTVDELNALWEPEFWREMFEDEVLVFDTMIGEFNAKVGLGDFGLEKW